MKRFHRFKGLLQIHRAIALVWVSAKGWLIASLALMAVQGLLPLAILYLIKMIVDRVVEGLAEPAPEGAMGSILGLILVLGMVTLLMAACRTAAEVVFEHQGQRVTDYVLDSIHRQSTTIDLSYYEDSRYHDNFHLAQQEAPYRATSIVESLTRLCQHIISLLALTGLLIYLHWAVAAVLLVAALPVILVKITHADHLYEWQKRRTQSERRAWDYHNMLTGTAFAKEIRLLNLGSLFRRRHRDMRTNLRHERLQLAKARSLSEWLAQVAAVFSLFGMLYYISWRTLQGTMTIGEMVMYFQAFQRAQGALQNVMGGLASLYEDNLFLGRFYGFMELESYITKPNLPVAIPRPMRDGIILQRVFFRYPGTEQDILRGIDLQISPGEVVALVGDNGAGKTTLAKLLCRLYDPTSGQVVIDSVDLRKFDPQELRREISMIFQDYICYPLSARENIWFGNIRLDPADRRIDWAAKQTGADKVIRNLPQKYETMLDKRFEAGVEISTGEWQKIVLSRAFLGNGQLIILDEPTSAISARAEYNLFQSFRKLLDGRAALLISHRFSTVRMADTICVLEKGQIVERGSHESLLKKAGQYAKLYELQAQKYR